MASRHWRSQSAVSSIFLDGCPGSASRFSNASAPLAASTTFMNMESRQRAGRPRFMDSPENTMKPTQHVCSRKVSGSSISSAVPLSALKLHACMCQVASAAGHTDRNTNSILSALGSITSISTHHHCSAMHTHNVSQPPGITKVSGP